MSLEDKIVTYNKTWTNIYTKMIYQLSMTKLAFSVNLPLGHVSQVVCLFLLFKFKLYQSEGFQSFHM